MTNLKSKIPVASRHSDDIDDMRLLNVNRFKQSELHRSNSSYSRRSNTIENSDSVLNGRSENKHEGFKYTRNTDNDDALKHHNESFKYRRNTITILGQEGDKLKGTKGYTLSYDPERDPGNEYEIEKQSNLDLQGTELNTPITRSNTPFVNGQVIPEIARIKKPQGNLSTIKSELDAETNFVSTLKTPDILFNSTPRGTTKNSLSDTYTIHRSATLDSYESDTSKTPTPRTPSDKTETSRISNVNDTASKVVTPIDKIETNSIYNFDDTPLVVEVPIIQHGERSTPTRTDTVSISRLSDTADLPTGRSSLPPPNFKNSLLYRVRKVSTPRRTPLFKPEPVKNETNVSKETKAVDIQKEGRSFLAHKSTSRANSNAEIPTQESARLNKRKRAIQNKTINDAGISAEVTFIKDVSNNRFERVTSSESVRSHYDKRTKSGDVDNGPSSSRKMEIDYEKRFEIVDLDNKASNLNVNYRKQMISPSNDSTITFKTDRNTDISFPSQSDARSLRIDKTNEAKVTTKAPFGGLPKGVQNADNKTVIRLSDRDSYKADLASLAKRRVTPGFSDTSIGLLTDNNYGQIRRKPYPKVNNSIVLDSVVNNSIVLDSVDDIFSEGEKRARLKQAQYITDDLKIVKRKVKTELVAQRINKHKTIHRKAILNNFNKQRIQETGDKKLPLTENKILIRQSNIARSKPIVPKNKTLHTLHNAMKENASKEGSHTDRQKRLMTLNSVNRSLKVKPSEKVNAEPRQAWADNEHNPKENSHRYSKLNSTLILNDDTAWRLEPKIHRVSQNKDRMSVLDRRHATSNTKQSVAHETNSTSSIVTWVADSVHSKRDIRRGTRKSVFSMTSQDTNSIKTFGIQRLSNKSVLKVKLQKRKRITPTNTIKLGVFMPVERRSIKQKTKHKNRVYTQVGKVKGYESEIPILYSDEDDVYPDPRPFTDSDQTRFPHHRRYEGEHDHMRINYRDPAHRKIGKSTGALVLFLRNGDKNFKGLRLAVNNRFKNFETLLVFLNEAIPTPTGVKYIFKWPDGAEITSVTEFRNRCVYLVSSTREIRRDIDYGESRENYWSNKKPSAGRLRKNELNLYQKPPSPKEQARQSPLIVTIINNLSRDKREKVILNPQTQQSFEEWVGDINSPDLPVHTLYTEKPPHTQVKSFSHLFRELRIRSNFIACGDEILPLEITKKRQAPSSNSSTESISESRSRTKKLPRQQDMGQIYENGGAETPRTTAMSRYDYGPRYPGSYPATRARESRKDYRDIIEIEIDGTVREFIPPSYADPRDDGAKPDKMLKCDWVYGFRGRDARHNLMVLPKSGELVYYVAAVVVLYNKDADKQRHYIQHNEEITCMMMHPNQYLVATGQMHGVEPDHASHIRIWHSETLSTYCVIGVGVFSGGIVSIGFSAEVIHTREDEKREAEGRKERKKISSGRYMCVLDGSEKHVLSVWDWQADSNNTDSGRIIARTTTSTEAVHCACFYPDGANNSILITYGAKHIYFWKIFYDAARKKEAKILRDRNSGIFEDDIPKSINCLAFLPNGDIVTGDTSGNLMVWDRDLADAFTCKIVIQAHTLPISSLCLLEDGTLMSGGGNEVKAWDTNTNFKAIKSRQIPQDAGSVRSIVTQTLGGIDGKLYIGTTHSAILDGSLQLKFRYLCQGHNEGVWGVVPHPYEPTFVSAGYDQVVFKWSLITHKVIWRSQIEAPCTSLAVDHRHELIALGTSEGIFVVLNAYNGMHIATVQVGTEPIGCMAFSPDGTLLAMGCNDGLISLFAIHERGQTYRKFNMSLRGHNSGVGHLDWSSDGRCIQSVADDHELIFWDVDSMQQIKITRMMRDVDWFTNTCHVAYNLIGPWSNIEKGELIKVVNRSSYRDLIVTGDTKGRIRLYKNPCAKEKTEYRNTRIYSSPVTAVAFTPDNRNILSCGGNDAALVQWSLIDDL